MRRFLLLLLVGIISTSFCLAQIQTQFYLANDSCNFVLPDYSQAVQVLDNCCVDSNGFYQTPHSGTLLFPGYDITVTLAGRDCAGNSVQMTFDVVVIDEVPPTFFYDSTQFLPMGMYQNEENIFKLYVTLDSTNLDDDGNPDYLTYYRDPNDGHQPIQTNIYDDRHQVSYLDHPNDWRAQIFTAPNNYMLTRIRLKIGRIGYDRNQEVIVELREVDGGDNPVGEVLSRGYKKMTEVYTMSDSIDEEGAWYTITMRPTEIYMHQQYAIIVRLNQADSENKLYWRTNEAGLNGGYAIWTNNGPDEIGNWEKNYTVDRLFEIWGHKI